MMADASVQSVKLQKDAKLQKASAEDQKAEVYLDRLLPFRQQDSHLMRSPQNISDGGGTCLSCL